jgi:hypothetical protein
MGRLFGGLAAVVLTASAGLAAADDVTVPNGTLVLSMAAQNEWRYTNGAGVVSRQALKTPPGNSDCTLLGYPQAGPDHLVNVTGSAPGAGFFARNNRELLGIIGPGTDCGRINQNQSLRFVLDGVLSDSAFLSANLKLNVKGNAVVVADVYLDSVLQDRRTLYSGRSIPARPLNSDEASCAGGSDSDPDNDATNCEWLIDLVGDELRLTVTTGQVGVGGLGSTSVFPIAGLAPKTGEIDCDVNRTTEAVEYLNSPAGEGANAFVQCRRLDNVVPGGEDSCEIVDYSLTASCDGDTCSVAFFHELEADDPLNTAKYAFLCETWWPERTGNFLSGELMVPETQQFFGPNNLRGTDLDFCEAVTPLFDAAAPACTYESGATVGACSIADIESVQVPLALDHQATVPGQQVGCVLDERVRQTEDTSGASVATFLYKLYQLWYLLGDYRASRQ